MENDALNPDEISLENESDNKTITKNDSSLENKENTQIVGLSSIDSLLETNISDWTYESARNYVVEFIATANKYKEDYLKKAEEQNKWVKRIELAKQTGKTELVEEAEKILIKLNVECEQLKNEYKKMEMHADILKKQLAEKNKFIPENDPTILLNKLENILEKSSEDIELEKNLKNISIQEKLEELKKKVSTENKSENNQK